MTHHKHRHHSPAIAVSLLVESIFIVSIEGKLNMLVTLKFTLPATRIDGSALAIADIRQVEVKRNGSVIGNPVPVAGANSMSFIDSTPLSGSDSYTVDTITADGLVSADSNAVVIAVPNANPASAVTDLTGVLTTP
jgi:hypothetical protein